MNNTLRADELNELIAEANRRNAIKDCKFFIKNYLLTFDPRPDVIPHDIPFELYDYEEELVDELLLAINDGYDAFLEKSRDMGASWTVLAVIFWCWLYMPGFQGLVGSRKEDYVDNGQLDSLFGKLDYFIRTIKDSLLLPKGFDNRKHRTYMKLVNPLNGNSIQGESANKNFSRAGRYTIVFFDEFAFWPDAKNSWQAAGDATKCRFAVTTPPNDPSYAKAVRFSGKIRVITLHWTKHPKKDEAWYADQQKRRTEDEMLHEIDISWEYSGSSRPYPEVDNLSFERYIFDPTSPIYISIDLGLDGVALGWYQPVKNSRFITMLEAYENNQRTIEWYYPFFGLDIDADASDRWPYSDEDLEFIRHVREWGKGIFYGDPSGNQKHIESGISAYEKLRKQGIHVQSNTKQNDWVARRDQTKSLFGHLRLNDTPGVRWWHECVKASRYPKREDTSQATTPIAKPIHDWTSHHRTQTEFFAVNYNGQPEPDSGIVTAGSKDPRQKSFVVNEDGVAEGFHIDLGNIVKKQTEDSRDWRYN